MIIESNTIVTAKDMTAPGASLSTSQRVTIINAGNRGAGVTHIELHAIPTLTDTNDCKSKYISYLFQYETFKPVYIKGGDITILELKPSTKGQPMGSEINDSLITVTQNQQQWIKLCLNVHFFTPELVMQVDNIPISKHTVDGPVSVSLDMRDWTDARTLYQRRHFKLF
jgi:hypothetical protein